MYLESSLGEITNLRKSKVESTLRTMRHYLFERTTVCVGPKWFLLDPEIAKPPNLIPMVSSIGPKQIALRVSFSLLETFFPGTFI
jgi:hypothetical protein